MSRLLTFSPADRVLIVAPHPDDESIGTGGLIQAAREAGAAVRVTVLTDGDANVWPQRWIEKRWRIDSAARARWGARRREEARQAMRVLGLNANDVVFLGLPDLGLTDLLMRADAAVASVLRVGIEAFAPNIVVLPAAADRHPDHSAANILTRLALGGSAGRYPHLLEFAVHGGLPEDGKVCALTAAQQARKREAILAHGTQMRLSSERFLHHAGPRETYVDAGKDAAIDPANPLRASLDGIGTLRVEIPLSQRLRGRALFVVLDDSSVQRRLLVRWKPGTRELPVFDMAAGQASGSAQAQQGARVVSLSVASGRGGWRQGFIKLARPQPGLWVFDRFGWQAVAQS